MYLNAHEVTEAVEWGERARTLAEELGDHAIVSHASTSVLSARILQGDPAVAEALRTLDNLGADHTARRLRSELRRRGVTRVPRGPRRSTAGNAHGLTGRQLEVLALLAEGLTNADIAERLTLSAKTVEHHVSAVIDKLQVANRGQAAAAAHRLQVAK